MQDYSTGKYRQFPSFPTCHTECDAISAYYWENKKTVFDSLTQHSTNYHSMHHNLKYFHSATVALF